MTHRRRFSRAQRVALFLAAGGRRQRCGRALGRDWHADHHVPWSAGGRTDLPNGRALCGPCNTTDGER